MRDVTFSPCRCVCAGPRSPPLHRASMATHCAGAGDKRLDRTDGVLLQSLAGESGRDAQLTLAGRGAGRRSSRPPAPATACRRPTLFSSRTFGPRARLRHAHRRPPPVDHLKAFGDPVVIQRHPHEGRAVERGATITRARRWVARPLGSARRPAGPPRQRWERLRLPLMWPKSAWDPAYTWDCGKPVLDQSSRRPRPDREGVGEARWRQPKRQAAGGQGGVESSRRGRWRWRRMPPRCSSTAR